MIAAKKKTGKYLTKHRVAKNAHTNFMFVKCMPVLKLTSADPSTQCSYLYALPSPPYLKIPMSHCLVLTCRLRIEHLRSVNWVPQHSNDVKVSRQIRWPASRGSVVVRGAIQECVNIWSRWQITQRWVRHAEEGPTPLLLLMRNQRLAVSDHSHDN